MCKEERVARGREQRRERKTGKREGKREERARDAVDQKEERAVSDRRGGEQCAKVVCHNR